MQTIQIQVRTILTLKKILGKGEIEMTIPSRSNLKDVLESMVKTYGEELKSNLFNSDGNILLHIRLMINGQDIAFLNKMKTVLEDGDEILILPPVAGG